jgi:integrase
VGGRTGRPRKHSQPADLNDKIYWRPSADGKTGAFSVAFRNPTTDRWTTRVILRGVSKSESRKADILKEANRLAAEEVAQYTPQRPVAPHDILVRVAWDDFLKNKRNRKKQPLKASTRQDYESVYENYFRGALSTPPRSRKDQKRKRQVRLSTMTPEQRNALGVNQLKELEARERKGLADFTLGQLAESWCDEAHLQGASRLRRWQEWLDTCAYQGDGVEPDREERTKSGLISLKRKANILLVMKSFLSYCAKRKWTPTNLGSDIEVPAGRDPEFNVPGYDDLMRLLEALSGQDRVFAELALYSGLRAGEMVALDWSDIDYKNEVINVRRSYSHGFMSDTTKGLKSRKVPLHDRITGLLKQWQAVCPSETMVFPATHLIKRDKDNHTKGDLVRVAKPGQRMSVDTFRHKAWTLATDAVGLKGMRLHDMRHAYITWLVSLNVNPFLIQAAAGHQDPKTTAIYLNLDPSIYDSLRSAFNAPRKKRKPTGAEPIKPLTEADINFAWEQEPKPKPAVKREKPEHKPGSGPVIVRRTAPKKSLS